VLPKNNAGVVLTCSQSLQSIDIFFKTVINKPVLFCAPGFVGQSIAGGSHQIKLSRFLSRTNYKCRYYFLETIRANGSALSRHPILQDELKSPQSQQSILQHLPEMYRMQSNQVRYCSNASMRMWSRLHQQLNRL